jgi:YVTN family beta-propeller protein
MQSTGIFLSRCFCLSFIVSFLLCGFGDGQAVSVHLAKTGVSTPGVQRSIVAIRPEAVFPVEGTPDWLVITEDAVWVTSSKVNHVARLDASTNKVSLIVTIPKPCSGLAAGFGSLWVPSCGNHTLDRVDPQTGKIVAEIPVGPADSEGGVTIGDGSVWLAADKQGVLSRIDPDTNKVVANISITSGSYVPVFAEGSVWITSSEHNLLTRVDTQSNRVVATIPIGPQPRFATVGAGSVWTLNQGDGTISRVDMKTNGLTATISAGIPGQGGEIAFGEGSVWATIFKIPITRIDPASNQVVQQWTGPGGDSIRVGHGSVWLSNLAQGNVWRLNPKQP